MRSVVIIQIFGVPCVCSVVCASCKTTDDFNTTLTSFIYVYAVFYTNNHARSLRMTEWKVPKLVDVLILKRYIVIYCICLNILQF
jgi:hypothetical protein